MVRSYHVFDTLIIGAGSAGLSALKEALKYTDNVALIHDGPPGTTCARVGCMPSKALIHAAKLYDSRTKMPEVGIEGFEHLSVNIPAIMDEVRSKRDHFVDYMNGQMERYKDYIIEGKAQFESPTTIRVGKKLMHTNSTIIATGSTPFIPEKYQPFSEQIITSDDLFERHDLPKRIAVIGMGAIGMEMAQALAMLGIDVTAINRSETVSVVEDSVIADTIQQALAEDMKLWLDTDPDITRSPDGITLYTPTQETTVDALFIATGRTPNTEDLRLEEIGVDLNGNGVPPFDRYTMKVRDVPIYIAGDVTDERAVLHEAIDEGRRAAFHALSDQKRYAPRYAQMQVIFTKPVTAVVGDTAYAMRHDEVVTGEADFENQGRAVIEQENYGKIRLYANQNGGHFRGAEIMAPAAEHLAHFLALALTQRLTIKEMLETPFYHPTLEEGLKTALKNAAKKLDSQESAAA